MKCHRIISKYFIITLFEQNIVYKYMNDVIVIWKNKWFEGIINYIVFCTVVSLHWTISWSKDIPKRDNSFQIKIVFLFDSIIIIFFLCEKFSKKFHNSNQWSENMKYFLGIFLCILPITIGFEIGNQLSSLIVLFFFIENFLISF